ncbi:hypothetical protein KDJ56_11205 [Brevibacillus composti]|uniref:Uncharacterized protein n=1 Tax=Brevibacillus composti TaxID=2796470 RepID=A0ABX7Z8L6_9BACL|nr:hypothetical protein [Brevibacillus composti]QUO43468.1 hypothetical protein KDJ56_11205 [Brevibacillus composti]
MAIKLMSGENDKVSISGSKLRIDSFEMLGSPVPAFELDCEELQGALVRLYLSPFGTYTVRANDWRGGWWQVAEIDLPPRSFRQVEQENQDTGELELVDVPIPLDLSKIEVKVWSLPSF